VLRLRANVIFKIVIAMRARTHYFHHVDQGLDRRPRSSRVCMVLGVRFRTIRLGDSARPGARRGVFLDSEP
jgi:hypothetical protein